MEGLWIAVGSPTYCLLLYNTFDSALILPESAAYSAHLRDCAVSPIVNPLLLLHCSVGVGHEALAVG